MNRDRHLASTNHQVRLKKLEILQQKGGIGALKKCDCGLILAASQMSQHLKSQHHELLTSWYRLGKPVCLLCELPYVVTLE